MYRCMAGWALLTALGLFAFSSCDEGGDMKGGPGADTTADPDAEAQNEAQTFTPSLSAESLQLEPGQRQELILSIDRGDEFNQRVSIQFEPPQGLRVLPETAEIQAEEKETKVLIEAEEGGQTGQELPLEVTFQPDQGKPVSKVLKVTVQQKDDGSQEPQQKEESSDTREKRS